MNEPLGIFMQLDKEGRKDVLRYAHVLLSAQKSGIQPPTAEEWSHLPWLVRLKIFFIAFGAVQRGRLQKLFCS